MADTNVYVPVVAAFDKDGLLLLNDDKNNNAKALLNVSL
ncbi:hypothetical protein UNSWDHB_43 [Dehalobacter sp. UNSWDHB]|jgi:hypothetical protein|nr:hypothetical protein UNSWDHB_43 [Dehalobacter sp. UNSWDHB]